MSTETSKAQDQVSASLTANKGAAERVGAGGVFTVTCVGADGVDIIYGAAINRTLQPYWDWAAEHGINISFVNLESTNN